MPYCLPSKHQHNERCFKTLCRFTILFVSKQKNLNVSTLQYGSIKQVCQCRESRHWDGETHDDLSSNFQENTRWNHHESSNISDVIVTSLSERWLIVEKLNTAKKFDSDVIIRYTVSKHLFRLIKIFRNSSAKSTRFERFINRGQDYVSRQR